MTDLFRFMHSILFRYVDRIGICPPQDRFFHRKGVQGRDLGTPRNPAPQVCQIVYYVLFMKNYAHLLNKCQMVS